MVNTNERLIRVNRLGRTGSIGCGKAKIGTAYRFSLSPDGTVAMYPARQDPLMYITDAVFGGFANYLSQLFHTPRGKALDDYAFQMLKAHPVKHKGSLRRTLFAAAEDVLEKWLSGDAETLAAFSHEPVQDERGVRHDVLYSILSKCEKRDADVSFVYRYKGAHSNNIDIPDDILRRLGWNKNQVVSVIERDDGSYLIRTAKENEQEFLYRKKAITEAGTVRGGRYLYLTKRQRRALGIGTELYTAGDDLKFTFDFVFTHTITVEPLTAEETETLPTIPVGKSDFFASVQTVKRHICGPIILPAEFCRRYDIQQDDVIGTKLENGKLIIYGRQDTCGFCGSLHDRGSLKTVPLCPECADVIDDVQGLIAASGSLKAAVAQSRRKAIEALKKLDELEV